MQSLRLLQVLGYIPAAHFVHKKRNRTHHHENWDTVFCRHKGWFQTQRQCWESFFWFVQLSMYSRSDKTDRKLLEEWTCSAFERSILTNSNEIHMWPWGSTWARAPNLKEMRNPFCNRIWRPVRKQRRTAPSYPREGFFVCTKRHVCWATKTHGDAHYNLCNSGKVISLLYFRLSFLPI